MTRVGWLALGVAVGCGKEAVREEGVAPIVDPSRAEHFFDWPFPSDEMRGPDGFVDLSEYPLPAIEPARGLVDGWARRVESASPGFANLTAAYFRFEGALDLGDTFETDGVPSDPVLWVSTDGELLPLEGRFQLDPAGDPFLAPNTLSVTPRLGHPPRSGKTWFAVVMRSAGAAPADTLPAGLDEALHAAGVTARPAVATRFTVQDATGMLRALADDVETRVGDAHVSWRRVDALEYVQGTTPSGKAGTRAITHFRDGGTAEVWMAAGAVDRVVDLTDWPMVVYEGELQTWNYQGLDGRPWMRPGFTSVFLDGDEMGGWMPFDGHGTLIGAPEPESMRVVLTLPRGPDGEPTDAVGVVIHDHGTGGHAYNPVQRKASSDLGREVQARYAEAGWAVIGRDATLYGARFPLIDEGYDSSLGFYNIANAPAFRDNQRQTAVDGHVLRQYVRSGLQADLPAGSVEVARVRRTGHSLGSVTANLGLAMAPDQYEGAFLSGTGGVFGLYFLETGLLGDIDPALTNGIFELVGAEPPEDPSTQALLGALLGLPQDRWPDLDRTHPSLQLFQWQMDPSDPMAVVRDETLPITFLVQPGDRLTPDFTGEALGAAAPDATVQYCHAQGSYDPHYCVWREEEGWDALSRWLDE